jgi:Concanavalin A-like lectin/glucanases superfamily
MKKQFQILATTIISIAIVSCSKQGIQMPETQKAAAEEISTSSVSPGRPVLDPLSVDLAGSYPFTGTLKDQTKKLADGQRMPLSRVNGAIYTYDRKGIANAALKFDGNYYVTIANVPVQQKMSLSVWVKRLTFPDAYSAPSIVRHNSTGIALMQDENGFWARVHSYASSSLTTSLYTGSSFPADQQWHHVVITYSAEEMTMYVDNQKIGPTTNIFTVVDKFTKYLLGYSHGIAGQYWEGTIDDLRFYNRTLSASDVQKLYNL